MLDEKGQKPEEFEYLFSITPLTIRILPPERTPIVLMLKLMAWEENDIKTIRPVLTETTIVRNCGFYTPTLSIIISQLPNVMINCSPQCLLYNPMFMTQKESLPSIEFEFSLLKWHAQNLPIERSKAILSEMQSFRLWIVATNLSDSDTRNVVDLETFFLKRTIDKCNYTVLKYRNIGPSESINKSQEYIAPFGTRLVKNLQYCGLRRRSSFVYSEH